MGGFGFFSGLVSVRVRVRVGFQLNICACVACVCVERDEVGEWFFLVTCVMCVMCGACRLKRGDEEKN